MSFKSRVSKQQRVFLILFLGSGLPGLWSPHACGNPSNFGFTSVTAGGNDHSCGIITSGAAYCWGDNVYGQLGNGRNTRSLAPEPLAGALTFKALAAGLYHTCGLTIGGIAYCWGRNDWGQLGNGTTHAR